MTRVTFNYRPINTAQACPALPTPSPICNNNKLELFLVLCDPCHCWHSPMDALFKVFFSNILDKTFQFYLFWSIYIHEVLIQFYQYFQWEFSMSLIFFVSWIICRLAYNLTLVKYISSCDLIGARPGAGLLLSDEGSCPQIETRG